MAKTDSASTRWFEVEDPQEMGSGSRGVNYLLAIGINAYQHMGRLSNCVQDAQDFVSVLVADYGFEPTHITELYDDEATRSAILKAFDTLSDTLSEDDNLIVYFAGHGYYKASNNIGCLVPVDAQKGATWSLIYNSVIRDYIKGIPAHHIFLVVDSCFSGDLILRSRGEGDHTEATESYADKVDGKPSRWGLAAGRIEEVADGIAGNNSPFNKALVTYLKTHHAQQFAVSDLINHVSKITTYNADQTPIGGVLDKSGHQGGEFVFRRAGASPHKYVPPPVAPLSKRRSKPQKISNRGTLQWNTVLSQKPLIIAGIIGLILLGVAAARCAFCPLLKQNLPLPWP